MQWISSGESGPVTLRAVLDANILISATFWKGASLRLFAYAEREYFVAIISPEILREYMRTLSEREFREKTERKGLNPLINKEQISRLCEEVDPVPVDLALTDRDDLHLFGCALAARATHLVTNDKAVLDVKTWRGIRVVTPEKFLELL